MPLKKVILNPAHTADNAARDISCGLVPFASQMNAWLSKSVPGDLPIELFSASISLMIAGDYPSLC